MRRTFWIIGGAALGLLVLLTGAYVFALKTDTGRRMVAGAATDAVGAALGGEASVGALAGDWPSLIILRDVSLKDGTGEWARIEEARLHWRPLSAVFGGLHVRELIIDGARLDKLPPPQERDEDAEPGDPISFDVE
ncbi:MAG: hypothetical protein AAGL49_13170, partial [Pseudomonadota bacterium]